jgi:AcrR family transcriptional regulator
MTISDIAKPRLRLSGEARQQQIVETVLDLVAEQGADGVSVQAIADRIGLTQPAVFRHFPNKEAIWVAVMTWLEGQLGAIHADARFGESPLTILKHMFIQHVRMVERHPALAKIVFSDHLRLQFPSVQTRFAGIHSAYERRIVTLLQRAKIQALVPASLPTNDAATLFLCMIQGLGFQFAIARRPMQLRREAHQVFALYLRAITTPLSPKGPSNGHRRTRSQRKNDKEDQQ